MRDDFTQPWSYWLKWAYTLLVVFLLMLPVLMSIYISFNAHGFSALVYEFTFDWYRVVLDDTLLVDSLKWTAWLAITMVFTSVPMGLIAAKYYKKTRHKVFFLALMLSPLFVPGDVMGSSLLVYFKNMNRMFESLGEYLGVDWFYGWFDLSYWTAVVAQILWTLPYAFIVILITMSRYKEQQTEAARDCGATAWQAFWHVEFPQIRVGILSSCSFVIILSFNEYVRTNLVKGGFDTVTSILVAQMLNTGMSPQAYAMAGMVSITSIVMIGSILIYSLINSERAERKNRVKNEPLIPN